ncbi:MULTISPECIES: hypothetical protein [Actibacterium]|uniref:Methionyl-tRNA formyltransferase n=1 Tax=Actibacterium naphthalenivorans TaxID=1614693 RepID=A0A840CA11_9RHOB|nr:MULTISPECIES: hypothetical protein [Actibacterium]MBB4020902.1 hypothetical protein [Actibacterium naphthalenivorans]
MAFVRSIERDDKEVRSAHPTQLVCKYMVGERDGMKVLQLNSYGSDDRDMPGKLSQTLQFSEESARQLYQILHAEFGFGDV